MFQVILNIWLCEDCTFASETGDFTSLDDHYDEAEAKQRMRDIERGLDALPGLVSDFRDDVNEYECSNCSHIAEEDKFETYKDFNGETWRVCPWCNDDDSARLRERGIEEFSRSECDCCGTYLAGTRMRFAQLIEQQLALPLETA